MFKHLRHNRAVVEAVQQGEGGVLQAALGGVLRVVAVYVDLLAALVSVFGFAGVECGGQQFAVQAACKGFVQGFAGGGSAHRVDSGAAVPQFAFGGHLQQQGFEGGVDALVVQDAAQGVGKRGVFGQICTILQRGFIGSDGAAVQGLPGFPTGERVVVVGEQVGELRVRVIKMQMHGGGEAAQQGRGNALHGAGKLQLIGLLGLVYNEHGFGVQAA